MILHGHTHAASYARECRKITWTLLVPCIAWLRLAPRQMLALKSHLCLSGVIPRKEKSALRSAKKFANEGTPASRQMTGLDTNALLELIQGWAV